MVTVRAIMATVALLVGLQAAVAQEMDAPSNHFIMSAAEAQTSDDLAIILQNATTSVFRQRLMERCYRFFNECVRPRACWSCGDRTAYGGLTHSPWDSFGFDITRYTVH